jgi:hypothetical protein
MKKEDIIKMANSHIEAAQAYFQKFSAELLQNPEYTVHWSQPLFTQTAVQAVWKQILDMAQGDTTFDDMVETLESHLVSSAKRTGNSSNFASNRLEQEKASAYADAYHEFRRRQRHMQNLASAQKA